MSPEEVKRLSSDDMQEFIFAHANDDEKKLLFKHKSILGLPTSLIAQQIAARKKAELKLPHFHQTRGVVYPPSLNLEQSSSEVTAKFKCEILEKEINGKKLKAADLTGGFGVDGFSLSQIVDELDYVEPNSELVEIAKHNSALLKYSNIHLHNQTAEDFLIGADGPFDFIFIDPSRRDSKSRKVFSLADCTPDITQLLQLLFEKTDFILLKASPLLDVKQGLKELRTVKKVFVISVGNECRELLFLIERNFAGESAVQTFNLDNIGLIKHAFEFKFSDEDISSSKFSQPKKYLFEPNASILKSGAFKLIGEKFGLNKLHVNTHFYTCDEMLKNFPGRIFEIEQLSFDAKSLADRQVNIITRNYPLSPEELKKKFKLKDGGEKYVIAFTGQEKKYVTLAKRLA